MAEHLPDPVWTESAELCVGCNYALSGLPAPGKCPECGLGFDARQLVLAGVANKSTRSSPARRLAWIVVIVGSVIGMTIWPVFMMMPAVVGIAVFVGIFGGFIALLATSPRERRGTERFVIAPGGIARLPLVVGKSVNTLDTLFTRWDGANAVELKRTSDVWRRLRVGVADSRGRMVRVVFDAGVRCPDSSAEMVAGVVRGFLGAREVTRGEGRTDG